MASFGSIRRPRRPPPAVSGRLRHLSGPAHFHAEYQGERASFGFDGNLLEGQGRGDVDPWLSVRTDVSIINAEMTPFDIGLSQKNAERRIGGATRSSARRPRSDRGRSRLDSRVLAALSDALSGQERPTMAEILAQVSERCRREGVTPPSRATAYKLLKSLPTPTYRVSKLPPRVRHALYNLGSESDVPAHQLAFYCFNYGDLAAVSFAAGLPWLAIHQALQLPGYRAKSRGLVEAVARTRGI